jgi:C4-dicarboxylate transporter
MIDELPPVDLYIYNIEANDDEVTESGLNKKISMMKLQDLEFLNYSFNTSIQDIIGMESASFLALDYESYSTDLNSTQIGGE